MGYTEDVFSALDLQDELQTLYTSGTVFHAFLGEKLPDWKSAAQLVRKIAENYKLPYYTLSPTYSVCREHGYLSGEHYTCPKCGEKAEVYSRITGYYRPVQNWNDGKAQEFKDRKTYDIGRSVLTHQGPLEEASQSPEEVLPEETVQKGAYLFVTPTCPNCKLAKALLDKAGVQYEVCIAEEHPDLAAEFGVKQAPTLVLVEGTAFTAYKGVSSIKGHLMGKE